MRLAILRASPLFVGLSACTTVHVHVYPPAAAATCAPVTESPPVAIAPAPPPPPPPPPPPRVQLGDPHWTEWSTTAQSFFGARIAVRCLPNGAPHAVWGSRHYTDDSSVCTAGVHAGVITFAQGGVFHITKEPGMSSYQASEQHGVTTASWGVWSGGFRIDEDVGAGDAESTPRVIRSIERTPPPSEPPFYHSIGRETDFEVLPTIDRNGKALDALVGLELSWTFRETDIAYTIESGIWFGKDSYGQGRFEIPGGLYLPYVCPGVRWYWNSGDANEVFGNLAMAVSVGGNLDTGTADGAVMELAGVGWEQHISGDVAFLYEIKGMLREAFAPEFTSADGARTNVSIGMIGQVGLILYGGKGHKK